ncbi:Tagatose-6-phosphate kinase [Pediococcus damnosus]|uniref:Tagatose-6-phosphate kinase n=1 Tax=Pediococcus damnosus TaxID=51663 RepID=A0A0R2GX66_9LACO|nr:1-phosphofructokinase [Pediococcus damnosus]AMV61456.1 Tagatose-6-phosphate kinase [Pediococcus damnosus]AMV62175.1 Tagatose-6-phosphate kinase [Pediococcus damnosus]AMV65818.1 Tagatose-6-phosphate kinase [Pediococcus damnosus]AMV67968.1 Tagatose-6-phosphate kinase [Pediococcus damnosus]KRN44747.1 fructose-1-phosphate kinase-like protein [Pediococcus damnosus]
MIYTLTLNPAIDLVIDTKTMQPNVVNRTESYDIQANGKGVNVSFILKRLGIENVALGIGGGFTIKYIEEVLNKSDITNDFVHVEKPTRINVFTRVQDENQEYKLVNKGPKTNKNQINELLKKIKKLKKDDILSLSGSFSEGIEPGILSQIARISEKNQFKLVIDTSYTEVLDTLKYHPYLIKPNEHEIASWFGMSKVPDQETLIKMGKELIHRGALNVLISLGGLGAVFINSHEVLFGNAAKGEVVNTAGSGDTMLGSFLGGMVTGLSSKENLKRALAAGSDTAFQSWITNFKNVPILEKQIQVKTID